MAVPTRRATQHLQKVLDMGSELPGIARAPNDVRKSTSDPDAPAQPDREIGRLVGATERMARTIATLARDVDHEAQTA